MAQYLTSYLEGHLDLSGKTRERYDELARLQIIPHLGGIKLAALTGAQVGAWHKKLVDKGLAPRTVNHAHRLLSQMLKRAVDDRKLPHNVACLRQAAKGHACKDRDTGARSDTDPHPRAGRSLRAADRALGACHRHEAR